MSSIRPEGATHTDSAGNYYKSAGELNWYCYTGMVWFEVGSMPAGSLTPLPSVQVVELEKFDAPTAPRVVRTDAPMPSLAPAPVVVSSEVGRMPQYSPMKPSTADNWGTSGQSPAPSLGNDNEPYTAHIMEYRFVGSRVTCNPPPLNTDQDVLLLIWPSNLQNFERKLLEDGFVQEDSNPTEMNASIDKESVFHSYRKGDMNYIVTTDEAFYQRFSTATELARKYNLMEKPDRIQLFQAVLYGKWWA